MKYIKLLLLFILLSRLPACGGDEGACWTYGFIVHKSGLEYVADCEMMEKDHCVGMWYEDGSCT